MFVHGLSRSGLLADVKDLIRLIRRIAIPVAGI